MCISSDHIAVATSSCSLPKSLPTDGVGQKAVNVSTGYRREAQVPT